MLESRGLPELDNILPLVRGAARVAAKGGGEACRRPDPDSLESRAYRGAVTNAGKKLGRFGRSEAQAGAMRAKADRGASLPPEGLYKRFKRCANRWGELQSLHHRFDSDRRRQRFATDDLSLEA